MLRIIREATGAGKSEHGLWVVGWGLQMQGPPAAAALRRCLCTLQEPKDKIVCDLVVSSPESDFFNCALAILEPHRPQSIVADGEDGSGGNLSGPSGRLAIR